ncbi:MAG: aminotransferase class I/II-fold pyridoxal phosphate-dependent enzyme [Phycisphaeraceae bacterium]|nr:aminotransferase class I/II-fold pyridoxal phosphate-dependent enzyme [Phycisphaeraceae bacterium]MCW5754767.1 aminotransferase class I/II-fold pyridoxal phosphate-dependent enzyme [Phycisphaeraceae bacterium]
MDLSRLVSARARAVDASRIRRVFELARTLKDPINLSIGQPDFPVPEPIRRAAIAAIERGDNGYTVTQGIEPLRQAITRRLGDELGWSIGSETGLLVTTGTSGALMLAALVLLDPGDDIIIPDPYFVMYPQLATLTGGKAVYCPTGPDFRLTASRVEPLITARTKAVVLCSPGNPTGVVCTQAECRDLLELCRSRGIMLISDEIYDEFVFSDARTEPWATRSEARACPSPAREPGASANVLLVRGFGKTYGLTGWRMGYAAGPHWLIEPMTRLQQFSYVNAPSIAQWGCVEAFGCDLSPIVAEYERRRDLVTRLLSPVTDVAVPGGAFYAYPRVPPALGLTGQQFIERCLQHNVLVIPGNAFSREDTHIRISFATDPTRLEQGVRIIADLMRG